MDDLLKELDRMRQQLQLLQQEIRELKDEKKACLA